MVGTDSLLCEAEIALMMMAQVPGPGWPIRPLKSTTEGAAQTFYQALGWRTAKTDLFVAIDKLDKIAPEGIAVALEEEAGASTHAAHALALASISGIDAGVADQVLALGFAATVDEGLASWSPCSRPPRTSPRARCRRPQVALGLDFYTGSVYETTLVGHENLGSICSGGRYDSSPPRQARLPRRRAVHRRLPAARPRARRRPGARHTRPVPTAVSVAAADEEAPPAPSDRVARTLRARGVPTDVAPTAAKFGKQIRYADRRGIPFVWILGRTGGDEVKDIRSGSSCRPTRPRGPRRRRTLWPRVVVPVPAERR